MPSTSLKDVKSDHCIPATASDAKKNSNPSNIHTFIYTVYMCLYIYIYSRVFDSWHCYISYKSTEN